MLRSHDARMRALVWRMVGDAGTTDDVLQESYFRAFRSRSQFSGAADGLSAWLYRITYNTCIDHLRARRRADEVSLEAVVDSGSSRLQSVDSGDWAANRVVTRDALRQALDALTPEQTAAVVLIDLEELPYAQVAEILDVSVGTLSSRVNRGRAVLRTLLANESDRKAL